MKSKKENTIALIITTEFMNERTTILLRLSENNGLLHTTLPSPSGESLFESLSRCWSLIVMISREA